MIRTLGALLVLCLTLAAPPAYAEMMCMSGPMAPHAISVANDEGVAGSGGVIVASGEALPAWRFRDVNRVASPRVIVLAPGLGLYQPPPTVGPELVLEDVAQRVVHVTKRALQVQPAREPPRLEKVTAVMTTKDQPRASTTILLDKDPPPGLRLVVISKLVGGREVPMSWVEINGSARRAIEVFHTPWGCEQTIPSAIEPRPGDRVSVRWIDAAGRISEPSNAVTIASARRPAAR